MTDEIAKRIAELEARLANAEARIAAMEWRRSWTDRGAPDVRYSHAAYLYGWFDMATGESVPGVLNGGGTKEEQEFWLDKMGFGSTRWQA